MLTRHVNLRYNTVCEITGERTLTEHFQKSQHSWIEFVYDLRRNNHDLAYLLKKAQIQVVLKYLKPFY